MHRIYQTSFQTEYPLFAYRSFFAEGRKFERGQQFPWKEMGISPEKVALLYRTGKVRHQEGDLPKAIVKPEPIEAPLKPEPVEDTVEARDELDDLSMPELRAIADEVGAPYKVSKSDQRDAIREARG